MPRPKVFVTRIIPDAGLDRVKAFCEADVWEDPLPPPYEVLRRRAADCEGVLSLLTDRIDADFFRHTPRLKVVSNFAVGFNNVDVPAATGRGIPVGNTPEVLTEATADLAFCLLIAAARRLVEAERSIHAGAWKTWEPLGFIGRDLPGKTLGVVGMGRIGQALTRRCRGGWGMRILYHDVNAIPDAERELGAKRVDLDTLLAESDFVSVHANLTGETRGMFDREAFAKMKPTAVFVNTARGPLHVQKDLHWALTTGEIFAAGLDVTDPEPMAKEDPLLTLPNLIVAPHIASATRESRDGMAEIAADNLIAGLKGEPLRACVNPEVLARRR